MSSLSLVDWAIVAVFLIGTFFVGFWVSRGQRNLNDYLLGDRKLPWWAVLFSIVATESSIVTFLSVPGLVTALPSNPESGDFRFLQLPIGYIVGRYIVIWLLLPAYFRGEMLTAYQVLGERFGGNTKRLASLLFVVTRTLADGLRLLLAAYAMRALFDLELIPSIVSLGVATLVYTYFGGVKAVVWTENAQFVMKVVGTAAVGWAAYNAAGGWNVVHQYALEHDKYRVFYFDLDFTKILTFWAGLVGGTFVSLASHGVDQMMVQRYLCAGTLPAARRALALSGWIVLVLFAFVLFVGLGLACYFDQHPPEPPFEKNDQVFPRFLRLRELLPVGCVGLMVAAVLSAAMSTLSSSLNASAGAVVADWIIPWRNWATTSREALVATRGLTLAFGIIQMNVAYWFRNETSAVYRVLDIAGYVTGIVLGLFFLGSFTKARERSALIALLLIVAITLPMKFLTPLAWPWYAPLCSLGLLVIGVLVETVMPKKSPTP